MGDSYEELSKKLLFEKSENLRKIWEMTCTAEEADILNATPATAAELAARFGKSPEEIATVLQKLYHRGAAFEQVKGEQTIYRMPRHVIQFHDANINWLEAPAELLRLWAKFMDEDQAEFVDRIAGMGIPSFMRVIPVNQTIESGSKVLAYEDAEQMVRNARIIAVVDCVCRKSARKCDRPINNCLQLDKGADYALKRGHGRKLTAAEALEVLKECEKHELVHTAENRSGSTNICNCCPCCCDMMRYAKHSRTKFIISPSRFLARVDGEACTSCGACVDVCPVDAMTMNQDDLAVVDGEICVGCGLCATACPTEAIALQETRPETHIP